MHNVKLKKLLALLCYRAGVWFLLFYRRAWYGYTFRKIKLTQGQYAIVDAWMYEELNKYKWYAHKAKGTYYAYRAAKINEKRKSKNVKMHHEVMKLQGNFINPKSETLNPKPVLRPEIGTTEGRQIQNSNDKKFITLIDHINGDGRDNREANLRRASFSQNSQNRRKINRLCGSQYKGVWLDKKTRKWRVQICFGGRKKHLGYYSDEAEAARAYDAAALRYHGRFAKVNFKKKLSHKGHREN